MANTQRYGFTDIPIALLASVPGTGWTTVSTQQAALSTALVPVSTSGFPALTEFDIIVGVTNLDGSLTNAERMRVTDATSSPWVVVRGDSSLVHAVGESIYHELSATALLNNPGGRTTTGDFDYLGSDGRLARLAAGADRAFVTYASGVPIVRAIQSADLPDLSGTYATLSALSSGLAGKQNSITVADTQVLYSDGANNPSGHAGLLYNKTTSTLTAGSLFSGGHSAFGSTGAISATNVVSIREVSTALSGERYGLDVRLEANPPSDSSSFFYGGNFQATTAAGSTFNNPSHGIEGLFVGAWHQGSGAIDELIGNGIDVEQYGGGSAVQMRGLKIYFYAEDTVTTAYPLHVLVDANGGGGTFGNFTGLMIDDLSGLTATTKHAINYADRFVVDSLGNVSGLNFTLNGAQVATQTYVNAQGFVTASSAAAFTNKTGNISQWTNDSSFTTLAAVASVGYLTSVTAHNLLSATHGDTLSGSVARGSIIVGNSTPKWSALPVGAAATLLSSDGTDATWVAATGTGSPVRATSPTLVTPTLGVATATRLGIGVAADAAISLVVHGAGATSATTGLTVEDSANVDYFVARNDGTVGVGKSISLGTDSNFSLIAAGADFSGVVIVTNAVAGSYTSNANYIGGEVRFAGTNAFNAARGMSFIAASTNSNAGNSITGVYGRAAIKAASGRAATLVGGDFSARTDDATGGTVTTLTGLNSSILCDHASVIATAAYGVRVNDLTNVGTMTNTYGIHVGDMTTGTQTNQAYNLYLSDVNARNLLSGNTSIVGDLTLSAKNLITDTTTGMKIGTGTTQKIAFYNSTPIVQGASVADATGGAVIDSEARAAINALISRIEAVGLIATV